ncbi:RNA-binding cell elongation regulator Jag/EloR [Desulfobaculum sp. SPO524]|uniref:RNA-binding cell elongation regulator Jag/EloR n=1 Tax=Desulfobaculum sp. SPO524 TaxID=3378071 RepID=UPI0038531222
MTDFKEFEGNTVDEAIAVACRHFGVEREKLEVEILHGGTRGIFGLGKKQARISARRRSFTPERGILEDDFFKKELRRPSHKQGEPSPSSDSSASAAPTDSASAAPSAPRDASPKSAPQAAPKAQPKAQPKTPTDQPQKPHSAPAKPAPQTSAPEQPAQDAAKQPEKSAPRPERRPEAPRSKPAQQPHTPQRGGGPARQPARAEQSSRPAPPQDELDAVVREVMAELLKPIAGDQPTLTLSHEPGRVKVRIEDDANSGLIIGREGQTISALQYLANRIVSRRFESAIRIHLDAGDYRDKQDDNLRRMALHLADKAKAQGRTQSTKPLSSYHRRLVHLALQDDDTIQTRSKGDGPLKRVLIFPRRDR